ncbi:hypothetical protein QJS04_geneDACA018074 [Acorus gramineus]|uniref:Uncharacterized protein n=1 Tax=Acorus gramineus TaxID=55184 RepID=A0AAV9A9X7_ACOGR|nr:hypothetical protein QJS04_geneDACA018074 [Acorus gramineus]
MAGPAPIEVGARGTIGSLVSQEIEYFKKFDEKPKLDIADMASTSKSESPKPKSQFVSPRNKKKTVGGAVGAAILPNICAVVEVAETKLDMMVAAGYRSLKTDAKRSPRD